MRNSWIDAQKQLKEIINVRKLTLNFSSKIPQVEFYGDSGQNKRANDYLNQLIHKKNENLFELDNLEVKFLLEIFPKQLIAEL